MMNSYRRNERRSSRSLLVATVIVLFVFGLDLATGGLLRALVRNVSIRFWGVGSGIVEKLGKENIFSTRRALQEENTALQDELAALRVKASETPMLQEELDTLQRLVRLAERNPGTTAAISSSVKSSPYGTFSIRAGSTENVFKGNLVLASSGKDGFAIGRVSESNAHYSLVTELFAPGAHIDASVDGTLLQLEGRGALNARAEVPSGASVTKGDIVFSPEVGNRPIGIVLAVDLEPGGAYKTVYVRTPFSLSDLRYVYVVSNE